jgi:hypothetical protein
MDYAEHLVGVGVVRPTRDALYGLEGQSGS